MPRDADATRQRLLKAARTEFATHGLAGARVDRIAQNSGSNKAQIYHYFGSKDGLFDAVWGQFVGEVIESAAMEVHDLAGFAAHLTKLYATYPEVARLITWQRLERSAEVPLPISTDSIRRNVDAIAAAQEAGIVTTRFEPGVLYSLVLHVATLWDDMNPDVQSVVGLPDLQTRLTLVEQAMTCLLAPGPSSPSTNIDGAQDLVTRR
ncbi:MAG TPA: TetR family transcriptional regulator [Pseudonocardia sp.]